MSALWGLLWIACFALVLVAGWCAGIYLARREEVERNRKALRTGKWEDVLARRAW